MGVAAPLPQREASGGQEEAPVVTQQPPPPSDPSPAPTAAAAPPPAPPVAQQHPPAPAAEDKGTKTWAQLAKGSSAGPPLPPVVAVAPAPEPAAVPAPTFNGAAETEEAKPSRAAFRQPTTGGTARATQLEVFLGNLPHNATEEIVLDFFKVQLGNGYPSEPEPEPLASEEGAGEGKRSAPLCHCEG